jgi:8-oxo-dGTP pyrophosphatase MutT (NUDIX family)
MVYDKRDKLHIVAAAAVIRNPEGKYLVLKRSEKEVAYPGYWSFPGGKSEDNETIQETLEREALEEAGLRINGRKILLKETSFMRPDGQTVKLLSYLCFADHFDVIINENFTDFRWISIDELAGLKHAGIDEELKKAEEIYKSGIDIDIIATTSRKWTDYE